MQQTRTIEINGVTYTFESRDISSISASNKGDQFIGVWGPNKRFKLLYNSLSEGVCYNNTKIIVVNNLEQLKSSKLEFMKIGKYEVICDSFGISTKCGFNIFNNGTKWSVLISSSDIDSVENIGISAENFLNNAGAES